MTVALVFTIRTLETGSLLGQAIICPTVRYASVLWRGGAAHDGERLAREVKGLNCWSPSAFLAVTRVRALRQRPTASGDMPTLVEALRQREARRAQLERLVEAARSPGLSSTPMPHDALSR